MWQYLSVTVLHAEYRTERACQLPEYLGSTFRGVLGQELRAVSCVDTGSSCDVCRRPDICAAGALFDSSMVGQAGLPASPLEAPVAAAGFDQPRPYILAPPSRNRGAYAPDESIRLGLTLETRGVNDRIPELDGSQIVAESPAPTCQAVVAFITPAELKRKGQRIDRLDGPTFFRRLIRRIGTLVESYCSIPADAGPCDFHVLGALADQVTVKEQDVSMQTWERYSNRLEGKHPLSGLVGRAMLSDIPEPLWPYLILGQWVHVGKSASFGQGRYIVLPQADPMPKVTL
jgi:hypothetical protein